MRFVFGLRCPSLHYTLRCPSLPYTRTWFSHPCSLRTTWSPCSHQLANMTTHCIFDMDGLLLVCSMQYTRVAHPTAKKAHIAQLSRTLTRYPPHRTADLLGECLQDTETFYTIAQKQILARFNKEFTWELKSRQGCPPQCPWSCRTAQQAHHRTGH